MSWKVFNGRELTGRINRRIQIANIPSPRDPHHARAATERKQDNQTPPPLGRDVEPPHKRQRQHENCDVGQHVEDAGDERQLADIDAVAARDRRVPVVLDGDALEADGEHGREHPRAHEDGNAQKRPSEPVLREDALVEGEDRPLDRDDDYRVDDLRGDEVLGEGS